MKIASTLALSIYFSFAHGQIVMASLSYELPSLSITGWTIKRRLSGHINDSGMGMPSGHSGGEVLSPFCADDNMSDAAFILFSAKYYNVDLFIQAEYIVRLIREKNNVLSTAAVMRGQL